MRNKSIGSMTRGIALALLIGGAVFGLATKTSAQGLVEHFNTILMSNNAISTIYQPLGGTNIYVQLTNPPSGSTLVSNGIPGNIPGNSFFLGGLRDVNVAWVAGVYAVSNTLAGGTSGSNAVFGLNFSPDNQLWTTNNPLTLSVPFTSGNSTNWVVAVYPLQSNTNVFTPYRYGRWDYIQTGSTNGWVILTNYLLYFR